MIRSRRQQLSIVLGADTVTGVLRGTGTAATVSWQAQEPGVVAALEAALQELRARLAAETGAGIDVTRADLVLLPPLADARLIPLPPLRAAEAEAVIRRAAARYFVGTNGERALAVRVPGRRRAGGHAPVLAVAASETLIEQARAAARAVGWRVQRIVPAVAAWLAAVPASTPGTIVAQVGDTLHLLRSEDGLVQLRRVPAREPESLLEAAGAEAGRVHLWLDPALRPAIERHFGAAGWQIEPRTSGSGDAAQLAGLFAHAAGLELVPPSFANERRTMQQRRARQLVAAAVLLLLATGAVDLWGERRELAALRALRTAIRADVAPLVATRDSMNVFEQRVAQIGALQTGTARVTAAFFDLAMLLPEDTHLRTLRASGDTLLIEAIGSRAGDAIQALRGAPTLRDVRLRGQVERQLEDGSTATERFTLQARLAPQDSMRAQADRPRAVSPRRGQS